MDTIKVFKYMLEIEADTLTDTILDIYASQKDKKRSLVVNYNRNEKVPLSTFITHKMTTLDISPQLRDLFTIIDASRPTGLH
jgi:hypothetical protein